MIRLGAFRIGRKGRSFLREVSIIIVGVLIALILEQLASNWRDRQRSADIRASMDTELADATAVLSIRVAAAPCIVAKLDSIDQVLAPSDDAGPWQNVGRPPFFFSSTGAWNSDASDLLSRHLGPERLLFYGEAYEGIDRFDALGLEEQAQWVALQTLEHQDEPITGERRWRLMEAAAGARNSHLLMNAIAEQMLAMIDRLGIERRELIPPAQLRERALCRPLSNEEAQSAVIPLDASAERPRTGR